MSADIDVGQRWPNFRSSASLGSAVRDFLLLCEPAAAVEMSPGQHPGVVARRGEIEAELLLDVVHEVSRIGEGTVVVPGELVQHQTAGFADAQRVLEQIDQRLLGSSRADIANRFLSQSGVRSQSLLTSDS